MVLNGRFKFWVPMIFTAVLGLCGVVSSLMLVQNERQNTANEHLGRIEENVINLKEDNSELKSIISALNARVRAVEIAVGKQK